MVNRTAGRVWIVAKKKKKSRALGPALPPPSPPRFAVGDRVRVRPGTTDPDYPDLPMGGWVGVVEDVNVTRTETLYQVEWSGATLAAVNPVYFRRCERDELDEESSWLGEKDLEPDTGDLVAIEQPTKLVPQPLDLKHPADLARHILGLTRDDDLPAITPQRLARFHEYLRERVKKPVPALVEEPSMFRSAQNIHPALILRVLPLPPDPETLDVQVEVQIEDEVVEMPLAEVLPLPGPPEAVALRAFQHWIEEEDEEDEGDEESDEDEENESVAALLPSNPILVFLVAWTVAGAVLASLLEAMPATRLVAQGGAALLGLLGAVAGGYFDLGTRRLTNRRPNVIVGALGGLLVGASLGATIAALAVAWVGVICGAIVGTLSSYLLALFGVRRPPTFRLTLLGVAVGAVVLAYQSDASAALNGLWHGALAGFGANLLFWLVIAYFARIAPFGQQLPSEGTPPE
jgi:hypothetical protein